VSLMRLFTPQPNEMVVELLPEAVLVTRRGETKRFPVCSEADRGIVLRGLRTSTGVIGRLAAPKLRLRISRDKCLVHELKIPSGAGNRAAEIADLDLRAAIPFNCEEIYSAQIETDQTRGAVTVTSIIIKRRWLDEQLEILKQAGVQANFADAWDAQGVRPFPIDFLGGRGDYLTRRVKLSATILAGAALVLLIAAVQISWWRHQDALAKLDHKISQSKESAAKIVNESVAADALAEALTTVRRKKAIETSALVSWDALSRLMPDSAWLSQLRRDGEKITITGAAAEAAPLIGLIDHDPQFTAVSFASPVNYDSNLGAERFAITMSLEEIEIPGPATR
jgi:general secretion pathway protein L